MPYHLNTPEIPQGMRVMVPCHQASHVHSRWLVLAYLRQYVPFNFDLLTLADREAITTRFTDRQFRGFLALPKDMALTMVALQRTPPYTLEVAMSDDIFAICLVESMDKDNSMRWQSWALAAVYS